MNLYLVRHGDALPRGGSIATDAERPLSAQGEGDARRAGLLLSRVDPAIRLVLTSPVVRAVNTGRLIAEAFVGHPDVVPSERLRAGSRIDTMVQEILAAERESLVVVGHQPDLGNLIAWLVADQGPAALILPPGTVACIGMQSDAVHPRASLRWLIPPDLIRQLPHGA